MDVRDPVGIEAMLPARRSGVRIQFRRSRCFCFPKKSLDQLWAPPTFLFNGYRVFSPGVKRPGREVQHSPHLVSVLRMRGGVPLIPQYTFMAWTSKLRVL